jgi:NAD(P)-dependent dehydrogenase (short-subunit alcohol dehydrogenase family)
MPSPQHLYALWVAWHPIASRVVVNRDQRQADHRLSNRLAGKTAIITGAGSGIGRATAITFAQEGAQVVAADVSPATVEVVSEIAAGGGEAFFVPTDVRNRADNERMVDACQDRYGRVDVLFCNAGVAVPKLVTDTTDDEIEHLLAVNVKALIYADRYAVPVMLAQGSGVVLFNASKAGLVGQVGSPVYCATKGAVVLLSKALALDYAAHGIRVNALCPGIVDTPMFRGFVEGLPDPEAALARAQTEQPIGRLGTAQECAEAALWLASDEASLVTGVALPIDGGITAM